jgi:hypothetical protein
MLCIRKDQMAILSAHALRRFENCAVNQLRESFPDETQALGEEKLRKFINHGIEKARNYNLHEEETVGFFLQFMMIYGENFEMNPDAEWALPILNNRELTSFEKIDQLEIHEVFSSPEQS